MTNVAMPPLSATPCHKGRTVVWGCCPHQHIVAPLPQVRSRRPTPVRASAANPATRRGFVLGLLTIPVAAGTFSSRAEDLKVDIDPKGAMLKGRSAKDLIDAAESTFAESDLLRALRDKTALNRDKNKRDIQDKYCYRQAEMGVGDCAGLQLIPGMTKSGKQKTPGWLEKLLGGDKEAESQ